MHFKCSLSLVSLKQVIPVENILIVISCIDVARQHSYHLTQLPILVEDHAKKDNMAKLWAELDRDTVKMLEQCSNMTVRVLYDCQFVCIRWYYRKPMDFLVSHILSSGIFTPTCTKKD